MERKKEPGWAYSPLLASMGNFQGQRCCWDSALYIVIYSAHFHAWLWLRSYLCAYREEEMFSFTTMTVLLGSGLCKGREKPIVYTCKEFTRRHEAACKAKEEVSYLTLKLMNHWFKRASELRASGSSSNSRMHFWVRQQTLQGRQISERGTGRKNGMNCPLSTQNFYFWRLTSQAWVLPLLLTHTTLLRGIPGSLARYVKLVFKMSEETCWLGFTASHLHLTGTTSDSLEILRV